MGCPRIVGRGCVELIGVIAHIFSFWFIIWQHSVVRGRVE